MTNVRFGILLIVALSIAGCAKSTTSNSNSSNKNSPVASPASASANSGGTVTTSNTQPLKTPAPAQVPTKIVFLNQTNHAISIYWVNFEGNEELYTRLDPEGTYTPNTFVGHVWHIRDSASGRLIKEVVNNSPETLEAEITDR